MIFNCFPSWLPWAVKSDVRKCQKFQTKVLKLHGSFKLHSEPVCIAYHGEFCRSWWRYQMETIATSLALCLGNPLVTSGFPSQRASNMGFDVFFDAGLIKQLNKQSSHWWFQTPACSLWCHCNVSLQWLCVAIVCGNHISVIFEWNFKKFRETNQLLTTILLYYKP